MRCQVHERLRENVVVLVYVMLSIVSLNCEYHVVLLEVVNLIPYLDIFLLFFLFLIIRFLTNYDIGFEIGSKCKPCCY